MTRLLAGKMPLQFAMTKLIYCSNLPEHLTIDVRVVQEGEQSEWQPVHGSQPPCTECECTPYCLVERKSKRNGHEIRNSYPQTIIEAIIWTVVRVWRAHYSANPDWQRHRESKWKCRDEG